MNKMAGDLEKPENDTTVGVEDDYDAEFQKALDIENGNVKSEAEDDLDNDESEESPGGSEEPDTDDNDTGDNPSDESDPEEKIDADQRYRELQSYKDKVINTKDDEIRALQDKLKAFEIDQTSDDAEKPPAEKEKFDVDSFIKGIPEEDRQIFEDNPEIVKYLANNQAGVSESKVAEMVQNALAEQQQKFDAEKQNEFDSQEVERQLGDLEKAIPGARKIIDDPVFQAWRSQNSAVADAISEKEGGEVEGAVAVLNHYRSVMHAHIDNTQTKDAILKSTSKSPKNRSTRKAKTASADDYEGSFAEFEKDAHNL